MFTITLQHDDGKVEVIDVDTQEVLAHTPEKYSGPNYDEVNHSGPLGQDDWSELAAMARDEHEFALGKRVCPEGYESGTHTWSDHSEPEFDEDPWDAHVALKDEEEWLLQREEERQLAYAASQADLSTVRVRRVPDAGKYLRGAWMDGRGRHQRRLWLVRDIGRLVKQLDRDPGARRTVEWVEGQRSLMAARSELRRLVSRRGVVA